MTDVRAASLTGKLVEGFTKATDVFDSAAEWMGKYRILSPLTSVAEKGADMFEGLAAFAPRRAVHLICDVEREGAAAELRAPE